jgi:tetratricopeptide (TPR) repeat protein
LKFFDEHPAAPSRLALAVAELCYEIGHAGNDGKWQEAATRLCQQIVGRPASPQEEAHARHILAISQPRERRAERLTELRNAYALVQDPKSEDHDAWRCLARIANSLAEELSRGSAAECDEARRLFEYRLQLNDERQLGDVRGVAMAVAGLGRLDWFHEPKDVSSAEKHFQKDLEISEAIGDVVGQVKMHSFLGGCALERKDADQAAIHYRRSQELADNPIDRYFAGVGLLRCCQQQGRRDQFEAAAVQILDLVERERVPLDPDDGLQATLEACPTALRSNAVRRLLALLQPAPTAAMGGPQVRAPS